jgi:hypothetical protein
VGHVDTAAAVTCFPRSTSCPTNASANAATVKALVAGDATADSSYSFWSTAEDELNSLTGTNAKTTRVALWRARVAAGALPALATVSMVPIEIAGAGALGWSIGRALDTHVLGLTVDGGIFGGPFASSGVGYQAIGWEEVSCSTTAQPASDFFGPSSSGTVYACTSADGYQMVSPVSGFIGRMIVSDVGEGSGTGDGVPGSQLATYDVCATTSNVIFGSFACADWRVNLRNYIDGSLGSLPGTKATLYSVTQSGNTEAVVTRYISDSNFENRVSDAKWRDGGSHTHTTSTTHTPAGAETITDPELASAQSALDTAPVAGEWTDHILDPTYDDPIFPPVVWPQPLPNETYDEYTDRLTALGVLGAVTVEDALSPYSEGYGADSPVRIRIKTPAGVTVRVLDPLSWPTSDVSYPNNYETEITPNPADAPPVPTDGGSGCDGYLTASVDFGPLSTIDFGNKFPFGIFGYLYDTISPLSVSPVTPSVDWDIHLPAVGTFNFAADAHGLDSFMSYLRTLMAVFLVLGAVYLIAASFIKINLGNPGNAVADDDMGAISSDA